MKQVKTHIVLAAGVGLLLTACAQQPVAPVTGGYDKQSRTKKVVFTKAENLPKTPVPVVTPQAPLAKTTPQATSTTALSPAPQPAVSMVTHTVKPSETLYKIASDYDTSAAEILKANGMSSSADMRPGQILRVPAHSKPPLTAASLVERLLQGTPVASVQRTAPNPLSEIEPAAGPAQTSLNNTQIAYAEPKQAFPKAPVTAPVVPQSVALATPATTPEPTYITHAVQPKETIFRISQQYKVSVLDIMAANAFEKPQDLKAGTLVRVPVVAQTKSVASVAQPQLLPPVTSVGTAQPTPLKANPSVSEQETPAQPKALAFAKPKPKSETAAILAELKRGQIDEEAAQSPGMVWPVKGKVLQRFGDAANGVSYTGISIAVPTGTPVLASDAGTVLYADDGLKAYGKLVLLRHENGMVSAYAHNGYLLVKKGERVKKGQVIAASGASGNVADPQLHFELRQHASAVDPLRVLPKL